MDSVKEKHEIEKRIAEKLQYSHGHHVGLKSLKFLLTWQYPIVGFLNA